VKGALWWLFLAILFTLAVVFRQGMLSIFVLMLTLASAISSMWARYSLAGVTYRRRLVDQQIAYGEETRLILEFVNAKPLPLAWLLVHDRFPKQVELLTDEVVSVPTQLTALFTTLLSLRWYERVIHTHRVRGTQRGRFRFGPAQLASGDVFGFRRSERWDQRADDLIVYPKIVPVEVLGLPAGRPMGEWLGHRRIVEDPLRFAAVRDYVPGDMLRAVHWKASAHTGTLQTKIFDPSNALSLILAVDVQTALYGYSYMPECLELIICAAASLAVEALNQRYAVGLYSNGIGLEGERGIGVRPGRHPQQMPFLLAQLASLTSFHGRLFTEMLEELRLQLPFGATVVAITGMAGNAIYEVLLAIQEAGHPVLLLTVGDDPVQVPEALPSFYLGGRDAWHRLETLELA
jgi:uncharacterized protein (DUF58 family)